MLELDFRDEIVISASTLEILSDFRQAERVAMGASLPSEDASAAANHATLIVAWLASYLQAHSRVDTTPTEELTPLAVVIALRAVRQALKTTREDYHRLAPYFDASDGGALSRLIF